MMTYCGYEWISDYTYEGLMELLNRLCSDPVPMLRKPADG